MIFVVKINIVIITGGYSLGLDRERMRNQNTDGLPIEFVFIWDK